LRTGAAATSRPFCETTKRELYLVSGPTTVRLLKIDMPPCEAGAPTPIVIADDTRLAFGYRVRDAGKVAVVSAESWIVKFGYPNDEALGGHRYFKNGLGFYSAYEVLNSEWIEEMRVANSTHRGHSDGMFGGLRHYIFTFHDSTLEFVATDELEVSLAAGDIRTQVWNAYARTT
jgi:hypothetical protein